MKFTLPDLRSEWPGWLRWLSVAHRDAIELFPEPAYQQLRLDHSILGKRLTILSDPEAIAHVCGTGSRRYKLANLHMRMLRPALGTGLVVADGKAWTLQRRHAFKLMPAAHEDPIQHFIETRIDLTLQTWQNRTVGSAQLINDLVALSIDLIAIAVFRHCEPVAHEGILRAINAHRKNIERMDFMDALGLPEWLYSPRMLRAHAIGHSIDAEINETIRYAAAKTSLAKAAAAPMPLSRDFVLSLITGFESVATTSLWLLGILASHRHLQEEVAADTTAMNIVSRKLPLDGGALDRAVLETLRLFPPLPFIFRQATQDDQTPAGAVRKGTLVCISPWLAHRHRALWTDPDDFDLSRFTGLTKLPDAFIPFGVGARRCVGMGVGFNLIKQIARRALGRFALSRDAAGPLPPPRGGVSLRPAGTFDLRFSTL